MKPFLRFSGKSTAAWLFPTISPPVLIEVEADGKLSNPGHMGGVDQYIILIEGNIKMVLGGTILICTRAIPFVSKVILSMSLSIIVKGPPCLSMSWFTVDL